MSAPCRNRFFWAGCGLAIFLFLVGFLPYLLLDHFLN